MRITRMFRVGVGLLAAGAAVVLAAPAAPAATGDPIHGWGSYMSFANQSQPLTTLTACSTEFHGQLTAGGGGATGTTIRVDDFSFGCQPGTSVTAQALPWTFEFTNYGVALRGVDVNITTPQGNCRYSGDLEYGAFQFPPNIYSVTGALHRRGGDCGGTDVLGVAELTEVFAGL